MRQRFCSMRLYRARAQRARAIQVAQGNRAPVSVVIPCYRCSGTIQSSLASVASQTLLPEEVLLVDDDSGDHTVECLQRMAAEYPAGWVKVIRLQHNGGPSCARNAGWRAARCERIGFLDADDTWSPCKLELQMAVLKVDPAIALISHCMQVLPRSRPAPPLHYPIRTTLLARQDFLTKNPVPTASAIVRASLPFRFNEDFRRAEDFLLWAQIGLSGHRCAKINQVLAAWHKPTFGAAGLSADLKAMHRAGRDARAELFRQGLLGPIENCLALAMGTVRRTRRHLIMAQRRISPARELDAS